MGQWLEDGEPAPQPSRLVLGFHDGHRAVFKGMTRAVSYVCKYIGKELAPSPNGDGPGAPEDWGCWYYSWWAPGAAPGHLRRADFRQAEQEPGPTASICSQAGISFVQFHSMRKG